MSFSKIIIIGNVGKDPEVRYTPQGQAVCEFSVATEVRKSKTEKSTQWYKVTMWGANAENAGKYVTKGRQVYVDGELIVEEYTNKQGEKKFSLNVKGQQLQFLSGGNSEKTQSAAAGGTTSFLTGNQGKAREVGDSEDVTEDD